MTKKKFLAGADFWIESEGCRFYYDKKNKCLCYYGGLNWGCWAFDVSYIGISFFEIQSSGNNNNTDIQLIKYIVLQ